MPAPDLCRRGTARAVARRFGLSPQRFLGQSFLVDRGIRDRIVAELGDQPRLVVEIGCGLGSLTQGLLEAGHRVIGIEVDPAAVAALGLLRSHHPGLTVIRGDVLRLDPEQLGVVPPYTVVGNLPYRITGGVLPHVLAWRPAPEGCHFLLQREVAARITARPGAWSLATLAVRLVAEVERRFDVAPSSFWPQPEVHSSLVQLTPRPDVDRAAVERLLGLARPVFQQRRKQIRQGLASGLGVSPLEATAVLAAAGIDPARRPGTLETAEWAALGAAVAARRTTFV